MKASNQTYKFFFCLRENGKRDREKKILELVVESVDGQVKEENWKAEENILSIGDYRGN